MTSRPDDAFPVMLCGIDHDSADNEMRDMFFLDDPKSRRMAVTVRSRLAAQGVVVLSTCNRTEVWVHGGNGDPFPHMCRAAGISPSRYQDLFYHKRGDEVVPYLFELASGMRSALYGETTIIPQIIHSIDIARATGAADGVLEQLFRQAVTAAKEVHSSLRLAAADETVASAVQRMVEKYLAPVSLSGEPVLVIGSGEMARLTARSLLGRGCRVTMTIRDMEKASALVPEGCTAVPYESRLEHVSGKRIIISATSGLHHTLRKTDLASYLGGPVLLIDLAMPVDIDPRVREDERVKLVSLRELDVDQPRRRELERQAHAILEPAWERFFAWWRFHAHEPDVRMMARDGAADTLWRLRGVLDGMDMDDDERTALRCAIEDSARKAFSHQLYSRRYAGLTRKEKISDTKSWN
ncbi:NAD(P)-dependent oxidoreductase [Parasphaerochaeta coccoides]|uniref:Glutamyl-tRNA reductase n=1 Tax=Parasphaerochaeta coccoides (strain ATCC BAA-1237 / DSM 17374 / SPN1) TaxID=760011 RepID=F4GHW6_PARC1|nr:NAD(P)-dependent oxidoreductase [Parasphaerochaeta coccoides]AEC02079.1 Glutamyl-tRNA reductase [Parasphaerochaeta coccoides DSM 17374]